MARNVEIKARIASVLGVAHDGERAEDGAAVAHDLLQRLRIDAAQLVSGAYVDLLHRRPA